VYRPAIYVAMYKAYPYISIREERDLFKVVTGERKM
jgi:hypothetical protein